MEVRFPKLFLQIINVFFLTKEKDYHAKKLFHTRNKSTGQAKIFHLHQSLRHQFHFDDVDVDYCFFQTELGGISSSLFESEMFGHKKGAFTDAVTDRKGRFEIADTGTIFLDKTGDLEHSSQVKLLRVLQEQTFEVLGSSQAKKIDVRVVSATNKNLEEMVANDTFREDLYYRINLIKIQIPPLRERREDFPLLVNFYVENLKEIYNNPELTINSKALL